MEFSRLPQKVKHGHPCSVKTDMAKRKTAQVTRPKGPRQSLRNWTELRFYCIYPITQTFSPFDYGLFWSTQLFLEGSRKSFDEFEEACQDFFDSTDGLVLRSDPKPDGPMTKSGG
ncbi:hypothetical protein KIN20_023991 [Parelaphostrongylus tenuis]|uniref:Uncharacterized protein n=1 Tax=Parelaphostrongylus tenuis TaxID=148309 RepID=A0AAD5MXP6_PARTN|nr:hypothetical protein KIN20_023991 [Parelaphostrongylus tenuis]